MYTNIAQTQVLIETNSGAYFFLIKSPSSSYIGRLFYQHSCSVAMNFPFLFFINIMRGTSPSVSIKEKVR
jgi:hypothetical protein